MWKHPDCSNSKFINLLSHWIRRIPPDLMIYVRSRGWREKSFCSFLKVFLFGAENRLYWTNWILQSCDFWWKSYSTLLRNNMTCWAKGLLEFFLGKLIRHYISGKNSRKMFRKNFRQKNRWGKVSGNRWLELRLLCPQTTPFRWITNAFHTLSFHFLNLQRSWNQGLGVSKN